MGDENKAAIISLVAQTHIHPGTGQSTGALDLPVARERTTHYPFIPGSGVKGAFRVWAKERAQGLDVDALFGKEGQADKDAGDAGSAGDLLCSDARLLLLPVRCLSDAFKWVTCPAILKRFANDCERAEIEDAPSFTVEIPEPAADEPHPYLGVGNEDFVLGLEEREFKKASPEIDSKIIDALAPITGQTELEQRLVIISNKDFTWFARYALPVMARNVLEENTKKSKNLWYEESLAPDTVLYLLFGERKDNAVKQITDAIPILKSKYIQMGGNETIGQGWFEMKKFDGKTS